MASLLIRNVDAALHARLKARALAHHRSLEEEVRETLRSALAREAAQAPALDVLALFAQHFGAANGIELEVPPRLTDTPRPPPDFSGPEDDR